MPSAAASCSLGRAVQARRVPDLIGESLAIQQLSASTTGALAVVGLLLAMLGA
jgi:hypothetical protein